MNETKNIFASRTVWAGVVAVAAGVAGIWGYSVNAEDQATIVELASSIAATLGGLGAIWGRVAASKAVAVTGKTEQ